MATAVHERGVVYEDGYHLVSQRKPDRGRHRSASRDRDASRERDASRNSSDGRFTVERERLGPCAADVTAPENCSASPVRWSMTAGDNFEPREWQISLALLGTRKGLQPTTSQAERSCGFRKYWWGSYVFANNDGGHWRKFRSVPCSAHSCLREGNFET